VKPLPRQSDDERLAALVARRNRTEAAIRRIKTKNEKTARAQDVGSDTPVLKQYVCPAKARRRLGMHPDMGRIFLIAARRIELHLINQWQLLSYRCALYGVIVGGMLSTTETYAQTYNYNSGPIPLQNVNSSCPLTATISGTFSIAPNPNAPPGYQPFTTYGFSGSSLNLTSANSSVITIAATGVLLNNNQVEAAGAGIEGFGGTPQNDYIAFYYSMAGFDLNEIATPTCYYFDNTQGTLTASPFTRKEKETAASNAMALHQIADNLNHATMALDGPLSIEGDVKDRIYVAILAEALGNNDQIFKQKVELAVGYVEFIRRLLPPRLLKKSSIPAILTDFLYLATSTEEVIQNAKVRDPPDPNFKTVVRPPVLSFLPTGNATVDKAIVHYLSYASLEAAVLHAAERWQGANLAGDTAHAALQLKALNTYSQQAAKAKVVVNQDNLALSALLPSVDVNRYPGGTVAIAAAFNAQCGQPLPSSSNSSLLSLGLSQTDIDDAICNYVNSIRPSDITTDFKPLLATPLQ
jgi:hypothetical protein